jgi:hypothetical protein
MSLVTTCDTLQVVVVVVVFVFVVVMLAVVVVVVLMLLVVVVVFIFLPALGSHRLAFCEISNLVSHTHCLET